jgi:glutathione synthase/RimK-type ligase-like ATP-grasp enzyme
MKKIAYLASRVTLPGSMIRRTDGFEHDNMMDALRGPFAARGMHVEDIAWDDPKADWSSYAAVLIGTTWDYWDHLEKFLATLELIETQTQLFNGAALVKWNGRKTYLRQLEAKGAKLIPTLWLDVCDEAAVKAAFDTLGSDDVVFKRQVGAGAKDQHRLKRGEPVPHMPHPMMAQPFLPMILTEGEMSFIFIDGEFCHGLIKRAQPGDYRIQSTYGGREEKITPSAEDLAAAQAIIGTLDEAPLYGRVDMLRGPDGGLLLMELEVIEPYLYPIEGPELGERLAAAISVRINKGPAK